MNFWLENPPLEGKFVCLEPLQPSLHAAPMFEHFEAQALTYTGGGLQHFTNLNEFQTHLEEQISRPNRVNWAVRMLESGAVAGRVLLFNLKPEHRSLEVGTLLMPAFWGSPANRESKLLLLTRAFEVLGVNRVQFVVDTENQRSLKSMAKLGMTQEAVLRQNFIRPDGSVRDQVVFSVVSSEWQDLKQKLDQNNQNS